MLNLWVFGTVRREKQMRFNLRGRDVREHPCMPNLNLGVKWCRRSFERALAQIS